ncbi:phosphohexomutase domain-containing protein [Natronoflexus pectinivorans]|uniref:Phosphomannomutase n=1 Tax=Natronoflexus pectinivorans TaxID=682526 RepID=A0A4R2GKP0_9BACT|nr:phosphoglucomutase [Natronoflexus pectinivorans]TCO08796.1 phosphomannomutase [Natronoflexus pectinivorans]
MSNFDWKKLQNGSDIRGIALEGVQNEAVNLTPEVVARLGEAFAAWLNENHPTSEQTRIAVGMDSRLSGPRLSKALTDQLSKCGIEVFDVGLASTPAMFMSTVMGEEPMHGAIMLTASHLPYNRNGLKFFTPKGGLEKEDITKILEYASGLQEFKSDGKGSVKSCYFMEKYAAHFVDLIRTKVNHPDHYDEPLKGLKIVVDAGNGAGGFYATKVLKPLGADISESQYLEPDGRFPNHIPNPEDDLAMASIIRKVKQVNADLGVIFDTDVDRAALVSHTGSPINRNSLIALISAVVLDEHPKTTIVTDSITSNGLEWFIKEHLKGKHKRYMRGYKNVINEAIRLNNDGEPCWLAIETSGHAALKENHFMDDGAYLVTKLIIKMAQLRKTGKNLTSLIDAMPIPAESAEIRIGINSPEFKEYGEKVIMNLGLLAGSKQGWDIAPDNFEGVRINCDIPGQKGWFLLRLSLHDPVIPLNIESEVEGGLIRIKEALMEFFKEYEKLDLSGFKNI